MLEDRCEIAFKVVLPDKDAKEIWIAQRAQNVPGQCCRAKHRDDQGVQESKWSAPLTRQCGPKQGCTARENYRGRALCEDRGAEKKSECDAQNRPRSRRLQYFAGAGHRGSQEAGEE